MAEPTFTFIRGTKARAAKVNRNFREALDDYRNFTYGETIAVNDALYLKAVDGKVYKTNASFNDERIHNFVGFAKEAGILNGVRKVQVGGKVTGFTGLIVGAEYYLSDTPGTIDTILGATNEMPIGIAVSTTAILLYQGMSKKYVDNSAKQLIYEDGSDGDVVIAANTTLTRDMFYRNLTINSGITLNPNGYRIFVKNIFINNGIIRRDGNNGLRAFGYGFGGGAGGTGLTENYLFGSVGGRTGGAGGVGTSSGGSGSWGISVSNALGLAGRTGGRGGAGIGGSRGSGGSGGIVHSSAGHFFRMLPFIALMVDFSPLTAEITLRKIQGSASGGGGGGGGGGSGTGSWGGSGGGSGSPGGIIFIATKKIENNNLISAKGGNGGAGQNGRPGFGGGGGGGGAGANGGVVVLIYNVKTGAGSIDVSGGIGGTKGLGDGNGADGTAGQNGVAGQIIEI